MNILLKSFLLSLAIITVIIAISSIAVLPEVYGLIVLVIAVFFGLWIYLYFMMK